MFNFHLILIKLSNYIRYFLLYMQIRFNIEEDSEGLRKEVFLHKLCSRFRKRRADLQKKYITKQSTDIPWEKNAGQFNEEQWKEFYEHHTSPEFRVRNYLKL